MSPTSIAFWRTFFGAVFLFAIAYFRNQSLTIDKGIIGWTALAGLLFSADLFFWHRSIVFTGAGIATILANTQIFGTALLSFFIFKERLSIKFTVSALAAFAGVALLIGLGSQIELTERYLRGVFYGILTGIAYAHYIVALKYAGKKQALPDPVTLMAWVSFFMALFLGSATFIENRGFFPPNLYSVSILFLLALVAQTIGWWSISSGLAKVQASQAGLILLLQPVLATVWGIHLLGESLTLMQWLGALLTLAAIYIGSVSQDKPASPVAV